jgi:hypothetical protein
MKLYKMAQIDPTTNKILHISIWDDPSKAPDLVELPDLAIVGITLEELTQRIESEKAKIQEIDRLREERAEKDYLMRREAPVPYPTDGERYTWNEETISWDLVSTVVTN